MPRLRPLALACLLACAAPAAYADCTVSDLSTLNYCIGTNSGAPILINANAGDGSISANGGQFNFVGNAPNVTLTLTSLSGNAGSSVSTSGNGNATLTTTNTFGIFVSSSLGLLASGSDTLTVTGGNIMANTPSAVLQIGDASHTGTVNVQTNILDLSVNSLAVTVNGGTAILSGTNTYTGNTSVNNATLQIGSPSNLGSSIVNLNNGKLVTTSTMTLAQPFFIQGGSTGTFAAASGTTLTLDSTAPTSLQIGTGSTILFGDAANNGTVVANFTNINAGTSYNVEVAAGTLQLGASTVSSQLLTNAAHVKVDSGATLDLANRSTILLGQLQGSGTVQTGSNAANVLTLGADTTFDGVVAGAGQLKTGTAVNITLTGGNTYSGGTSIVQSSTLTLAGSGTLGTGSVNIETGSKLVASRNDDYTLANNLSGGGTLVKNGSGTLTLSGNNTGFTGSTTINAGILAVGVGGLGGAVRPSVYLAGGELLTTETMTLLSTFNTNYNTTATVAAASGTVLTLNTEFILVQGSTMQFGDGSNNGTIVLGAGVLMPDNVYQLKVAGGTTLASDGSAAMLGNLTRLASLTTVDSGATLDFAGQDATIRQLAGSGTVNTGSSTTSTVTLGSGTSFSGSINGSGNIATSGGSVTLSGANGYSGTTTINTGSALTLTGNGTLGGGAVIDNDSLIVNKSSDSTIANDISGSGVLTKLGSGTLTLSGTNTYSGVTHVDGGTLAISSAANLSGTSYINLSGGTLLATDTLSLAKNIFGAANTTDTLAAASGKTLTLGASTALAGDTGTSFAFGGGTNTGTVDVQGTISGAGTAVNVNGGTLILAGTNTYDAGTSVQNGGTLQISAQANLGTANVVTLNGGTLVATADLTLGQDMDYSGTNTLAASAGKTLTLSGNTILLAPSALVFGDATHTGTVALANTTIVNSTNLAGGTLEVAGGSLTGSALNTYTSIAASTTVDSGGTLDLAGNDVTVKKLLGAGTVDTGTSSANTLTLGNGSVFSGSINGSGNLATSGSNAVVTLAGANTYSGSTTVAASTTLNVTGSGTLGSGAVTLDGTLAFDKSADATLANVLSGSGVLDKTGTGKLTLSGASTSFAGTTNVNGGTLAVNGTLNGTLNVNNGGVLGGSGIVGDVNVLSGGILAPGNSIGTLTVNGDLTFNAGSTYRVETDAAGNSDKTIVNGALTLAGTLDIQAGSGTYARNTSYTILTNTGLQSGSFATVTSNLAFLTPTVTYNANSVVLNMARNNASYSSVGGSANQVIIGQYLDRYGSGTGSSLADLVNRIDNLTAAGARSAFDGLSGSQHAVGSQVAQAAGSAFGQGLAGHLSHGGAGGSLGGDTGLLNGGGNSVTGSLPWGLAVDTPYQVAGMFSGGGAGSGGGIDGAASGASSGIRNAARETGAAASGDGTTASGYGSRPWGLNPNATSSLWGQALGGGGRVDSNGNGAGSTYRGGGFIVGADYALTPNWLVGAAAGYQRSTWDANTSGNAPANGKVETPQGALYARYTSGPWMVAASGSYSDNKFSTTRNVVIGSTTYMPVSTHKGGEWGAGVQAEVALAAGAWELRPLVGLRYARLKEEAFSESGGGVTNLAVDARTSRNTTLSAGMKGVYRFGSSGNEGAFELRAIASHLYGDNDTPVSARLAGQPASFTSNGTPLKRDAITVGAGISRRIGRQLSGFADVSYEDRGGGQNAYALTAGLRYAW